MKPELLLDPTMEERHVIARQVASDRAKMAAARSFVRRAANDPLRREVGR